MKKLVSVLLTLCMVLCMLPVPAAADDLPVVKLDVGTTETYDDTNYRVDADTIVLRAEGQVYELTGTTDRKILVPGTNTPAEPKTYHIRLNNVTINGGMTINNSTGAKLVIDVAAGTVNTVKSIYAAGLTITGSGTLNMEDMGVTQSTRTNNPSSLYIEDTTINVNLPSTRSGQWEGTCELAGSAKVTYTGCGKYTPLKLGQGNGMTHSLTLKDSAKLYCVQDDASDPASSSVSGLEAFNDATITLQDNAYLEAEGRATSGLYAGYGVSTGGNGSISVLGNATLKATAYDIAVCADNNITVNGGKLIAKSKGGASNGVYAAGTIDINNAYVEAEGGYPGMYGGTVIIANSTVKAVGTNDAAIWAASTLTLNNSIIVAEGADGFYGLGASDNTQVTGCWIETTGTETFDSDPNGIADSVLFNKKVGKVIGNASIPGDVTVESDMKLAIPAGTALTVPADTTLTNHGLITLRGTLNRDGTIICDSHNGGTATCVDKARCDICLAVYGDVDAANHTGSLVWAYTETSHTQKYDCCGAVVVAEEAHDWADGKCTKCGYTCKHAVGTPATCVDKAVCQYCGESFGDVDAANHSDLRHVTKVDATATADGNIEYWYCAGCGKYYSDAAATKEITKDATVIPAIKSADTTVKPVGGKDTWSKGSGTLDFVVEPGAQSIVVKVDGKDVDARNYTLTTDAKTGKTTVSLHADYLATLSLGTHKLAVTTADGTATTTFKVDRVYADAPSGKTDSKTDTKTGDGVKSAGTADNFPMASMAAALVLSAGALAVLTVRGRRKEQDAQ